MKEKFLGWILFLITICNGQYVGAQELLTNVYGRQYTFLNGKWNAVKYWLSMIIRLFWRV